jgi:hypothetical protein
MLSSFFFLILTSFYLPIVGVEGFLFAPNHTQRHTLGRTPQDEGSACRRDLYLTTHTTRNRQTSMPPAGFEHTIPASQRSQTHVLDSTVTGIGSYVINKGKRTGLIPCCSRNSFMMTVTTNASQRYCSVSQHNFSKEK